MKPKILFYTISFLTIIFNGKLIYAQKSLTDTIQIDEIIVTGSPVKVNRNNVPMAVSVVNHSQIESSHESAILPILNGRVPGLFVTERGVTGFGVAAGSAGQISIRGIGGNPTTGVLMLIDGHPQFMGIMGHPLPDSYVASDVERVEVIRGPASILYGSNAMGGVINIITRKHVQDGVNAHGRISYGSFNTQKYMGSAGFKKNNFSTYVSVNHDQTEGHREHSNFDINNGYLKLTYELNEHLFTSTDVSLAKFNAADPGPDTLNASFGETIDISRGYWAFTLLNEFEKNSGAVKLFYNFGEHHISDGFHSNDHNYGINLYESFRLFKGNNISVGFDYMNYGGIAENEKAMKGAGIVFADTTVSETGTYAFMQQTLADKLTMNAGLRFQNHSVYGKQWIPAVGFAYNINKTTTWKGTISKGFRSPTIRELFLWGPNSGLSPETILNYETGISKSFNKKIKGEITVFAVNGDNLIVNVPTKGYLNTGEISNKGVELEMNAAASTDLSFQVTYSFIHMKNSVYATPEHQLYFNVNYRFKKWQLTSSIQQIINLDNDASYKINRVNYTLLQAKTMYQLSRNLKFFVSAENLLNESYEVNRYYIMPGTTIFSGINLIL